MSNVPNVSNTALRKLVDALIASTVLQSGSAPAADPNAFKDRLGEQLTCDDTDEVEIIVRIKGSTASSIVLPVASKCSAIMGRIDTAVLATKLV